MKRRLTFLLAFLTAGILFAQHTMTPKDLWQVKDLSPVGISQDGQSFYYKVKTPNMAKNSFATNYYKMAITGGTAQEVKKEDMTYRNKNIAPNGKYELFHKKVHLKNVLGKDVYKDMPKSDVYIIHSLDYRHWDHYNDGSYQHVFYRPVHGNQDHAVDLMKGEPYYCPQAPFGGDEDYIWGPKGENVYYVSKKLVGTAYATSTNTDLYKYNLKTGKTEDITADNKGYDTHPEFSKKGALAWLQMKTPGYEADKNDIVVRYNGVQQNLTAQWDGTVASFCWADNAKDIYFNAPVDGTIQLFKVDYPGRTRKMPVVEQLSKGQFDVTSIIGQVGNKLLVTRTDMNHAAEIFSFDLKTHQFKQLTFVNKKLYDQFDLPKVKKRYVTTQDGHKMLVWVVYPPHFDSTKNTPLFYTVRAARRLPFLNSTPVDGIFS